MTRKGWFAVKQNNQLTNQPNIMAVFSTFCLAEGEMFLMSDWKRIYLFIIYNTT